MHVLDPERESFILRLESEIDALVAEKDVANFIPFLHFVAIVSRPIYIPSESRAESLKDLI